MNGVNRLKLFKKELKLIKDKNIRKFTCKILIKLPDYFFIIPASSTGKYHPKHCLGKGGLVRHVKAAVKIANIMFRDECTAPFNDIEKDIIISSLILHDGIKNGLNGSQWTDEQHPNLIAEFIKENYDETLDKEIIDKIIGCVRSHSGPWNLNKSGVEMFPRPESTMEQFVHLADYISSRREITINLEE